jgi:hypothetical protein
MADASTLIKHPSEHMSAFNKRLAEACEKFEVTEVSLHVVDGQPAITLFSEILLATAEDVAEALDEDPDSDLKEGEEMPERPPVFVQVARIEVGNDEAAKKSQDRMEKLYDRAAGQVVKLLVATGVVYGYFTSPLKKEVYGEQSFTYNAVVAYIPDEDDEDGDDGDEEMEENLRGSAAS